MSPVKHDEGIVIECGTVSARWIDATRPSFARSGRGRDAGYPAPPHRSVLALLTHTVLTSDIWRQTAHSATGVEPRLGGSIHQVAPENGSTSIGASGSAVVSGETIIEARHYGTPSFAPGCPVRRDIGNIREPPIGATSGSPGSIRASVFAVSAEYPSAWPPCVCRSSCE